MEIQEVSDAMERLKPLRRTLDDLQMVMDAGLQLEHDRQEKEAAFLELQARLDSLRQDVLGTIQQLAREQAAYGQWRGQMERQRAMDQAEDERMLAAARAERDAQFHVLAAEMARVKSAHAEGCAVVEAEREALERETAQARAVLETLKSRLAGVL